PPLCCRALQIPSRQQDLALARRDFALLVRHCPAARALLEETAFEWLDLNHEEIRLHGTLVVLGNGVVRDEIAGREQRRFARFLRTERFEIEQHSSSCFLDRAIERDTAPFTTIDR